MEITYRKAQAEDISQIFQLYAHAYQGHYPDSLFYNVDEIQATISSEEKLIFVATNGGAKVVACILFLYDKFNRLSKAGGAIVLPSHRGHKITENLIHFGIDYIKEKTSGMDVLYVTTRTVHKAAQILTQRIGFRQLGIFPNVHKTEEYETHALAALHFNDCIKHRYTDFEQHPIVLPLYNIVRKNIDLPQMKQAHMWQHKHYEGKIPTLEVVEAPQFIKRRSENLKEKNEIDLAFFPFKTPNLLITSPNQIIEVFANVNHVDKHCVITGCKIDREISFTDLFLKVSSILRDRGIRYIEIIIRANRLNIIDKIAKAKFIPCGYIPAFQHEGGKRYDYVVFSRSFEILDFNNLELTGENELYLKYYINQWERTFLGSFFKNDK